jgi:hypothetical protein
MNHRFAVLLATAALLAGGCADTKSPRLESWRDGGWQTVPTSAYRISGKRDGAQTSATAVFTLEDGRDLRVELSVVYNPTPALGAGQWKLGEDGGVVMAESLKFLGGQGEGPSLGGRFRLEGDDGPRYRVTLPLRPLE